MRRLKQPVIHGGKYIQAKALQSESPDPDKLPPKFSFRHLNRDYSISKCTDEEKVSFVDKMDRLSQLAWYELRQQSRHKLGYERPEDGGMEPQPASLERLKVVSPSIPPSSTE
jgi:hypothetical protein